MNVEALLSLFLPFAVGVGVLRALGIGFASDRIAYLGLVWIAGVLGSGLLLFAWLWTGPDLGSPWGMRLLLLLVAAGLHAWGQRRVPRAAALPVAVPGSRAERGVFGVVLTGLVLLVSLRILLGTLLPVLMDDEAEFWALKAKVLWHTGGFGQAFRAEMSEASFVYNKDYPFLNPILQLWSFVNAGGITHGVNRVPIQLFALAQLLLFAAAVRRVVRPLVASCLLVMLFALDETRYHARLAAGDVLTSVGLLCALDGWLRWRETGAAVWMRMCALGLALTVWSKNEGLLYAVAIAAGAVLTWGLGRRARVSPEPARSGRGWLLLPACVLAMHLVFNASQGFRSGFLSNPTREGNVLELFGAQLAEYGPVVLGHYTHEIFLAPWHANFAWPVFALLLLLFPVRLWKSELALPALVALGGLLGVMVVFIGAPHEIEKHLRTAAERVSFQLVPGLFLWIACVWTRILAADDDSAPLRRR